VYYSNGQVAQPLQQFCLNVLAQAVAVSGGEIIGVTWEPPPEDNLQFARNIIWPHRVSTHRNMYEQILAGISAARSDLIVLAEHDVLYPIGYYDCLIAATGAGICYNTNLRVLNSKGFFHPPVCHFLSNCGGKREVLAERIQAKIEEIRAEGTVAWAEPPGDSEFSSLYPTVDIRHGDNFTGGRDAPDGTYFSKIEYWGNSSTYTPLFTSGRSA
jgi:hypothetical protein